MALLGILGALVITVVLCLIFVPPIALMFRRSRHAVTWLICVLVLFVVVFVAGFTSPEQNPMRSSLELAGGIGSLLFGAFVWYLRGLTRQELLR
jgi:NADH:ubiquinone oxidoreductase subunit 6 (subunit J)